MGRWIEVHGRGWFRVGAQHAAPLRHSGHRSPFVDAAPLLVMDAAQIRCSFVDAAPHIIVPGFRVVICEIGLGRGAACCAPTSFGAPQSARKWLPRHAHRTTSCPYERAMASARQHAPPVDQTASTRLFSSRNLSRDDLRMFSPVWSCANRRNDPDSIWENRCGMLDGPSKSFLARPFRCIRCHARSSAWHCGPGSSLRAPFRNRSDRRRIAGRGRQIVQISGNGPDQFRARRPPWRDLATKLFRSDHPQSCRSRSCATVYPGQSGQVGSQTARSVMT